MRRKWNFVWWEKWSSFERQTDDWYEFHFHLKPWNELKSFEIAVFPMDRMWTRMILSALVDNNGWFDWKIIQIFIQIPLTCSRCPLHLRINIVSTCRLFVSYVVAASFSLPIKAQQHHHNGYYKDKSKQHIKWTSWKGPHKITASEKEFGAAQFSQLTKLERNTHKCQCFEVCINSY